MPLQRLSCFFFALITAKLRLKALLGCHSRFHLISYGVRMTFVAVMMTGSYLTVAYGRHMSWQLLGVTFAAFQGGLGEASTLALCSLYDSRRALTLWSSGTGFAGGSLKYGHCLVHAVMCTLLLQKHSHHSQQEGLVSCCGKSSPLYCSFGHLQHICCQ